MTKIVGVCPPSALAARSRLFAALGAAFRVHFEGRESGAWEGLDAAIVVGGSSGDVAGLPVLRYLGPETLATSSFGTAFVDLAVDSAVDARLQGRRLAERALVAAPERLEHGSPLARDDGGTVWASDDFGVQTCVVAPDELGLDEPLRSRLCAGRFLALVPLIQLLRRVSSYESWSRPPVRAAFLFDDPNLHRPTYGHIRFAELAEHARLHGYHVAFSTIPLDSWFAHPGTVRTFGAAASSLSLTVHGNDHRFAEFALPRPTADAIGVTAQALRRISRFEEKTGLSVDRVMVPPHGPCSDEMLNGMLFVGIEALCRDPVWWSNWPAERLATADWHMADVAPNGGSIIRRRHFLDPLVRDETALTIFLDQPVVLFGHHYDVSPGYEVLGETAEWLRGFGQVTWQRLSGLARSNYVSRAEPDSVLRIRSYSRRFSVAVPENVEKLLVELPSYDAIELDRLRDRHSEFELAVANGVASAEIPAPPAGQLELLLERRSVVSPAPLGRVNPSAVTRRAVAETRDRLQPIVERTGLNPVLRRLEAAYNRRMNARLREQARRGE